MLCWKLNYDRNYGPKNSTRWYVIKNARLNVLGWMQLHDRRQRPEDLLSSLGRRSYKSNPFACVDYHFAKSKSFDKKQRRELLYENIFHVYIHHWQLIEPRKNNESLKPCSTDSFYNDFLKNLWEYITMEIFSSCV